MTALGAHPVDRETNTSDTCSSSRLHALEHARLEDTTLPRSHSLWSSDSNPASENLLLTITPQSLFILLISFKTSIHNLMNQIVLEKTC